MSWALPVTASQGEQDRRARSWESDRVLRCHRSVLLATRRGDVQGSFSRGLIWRLVKIDACLLWALVLLSSRRLKGGLRALEAAERLDPSDPATQLRRGQLLEKLGRPEGAETAYRGAFRLCGLEIP